MFNHKLLKECREKSDQSQEDVLRGLAVLGLNVSRQTICNWETEATTPDVNDIAIIAKYFKKPVQFFFTSK